MTNKSLKCMTEAELAGCKMLFGPPPVLSTEDQKQFEGILDKVIMCLTPQDMVELIYIRQFVQASWIIDRFTRHGTVSIERWYRQSLQYQAQRMKIQKTRKEAQAQNKADQSGQAPRDIAHLVALEENIIESASDIDEILLRKATELEHNRALEKGILLQEQIERLITSATTRRNGALGQLELYRIGLGQLVRESTSEIIDGECHEVSRQPQESVVPPLVPSKEENTNGVEPQNSSESTQ
jgi:hypothetical protein